MLKEKKALLLIGSPKIKNSTSESLGNYLLEGLDKKGYVCEKLHILTSLKNSTEELLNKVNDTDILILSFPLYVDSLPSPVIRTLELIANHRRGRRVDKNQSFISIVNCGFPEAFHNDTVLKICKTFAEKNSFQWLGGLATGCGGAINGKAIEKLGGMTRNIVKALDTTVEAIANDRNIPSEAVTMMSSNLMPSWLYAFMGNLGWKSQAKQYNTAKKLYEKPYLRD